MGQYYQEMSLTKLKVRIKLFPQIFLKIIRNRLLWKKDLSQREINYTIP